MLSNINHKKSINTRGQQYFGSGSETLSLNYTIRDAFQFISIFMVKWDFSICSMYASNTEYIVISHKINIIR